MRNSCWEGEESIDAWTFKLNVDGQDRIFVIPASCLNLALLKDTPPTCKLKAKAECSNTSSPSTVTVTATAEAWGKSEITRVDFTVSLPDKSEKSYPDIEAPYDWKLDAVQSGIYSFEAVAYDTKELHSEVCKTEVAVCVGPKVELCTPPSCGLKAEGDWPEGSDSGTLKITVSQTEDFVLTVKDPDQEPVLDVPQGKEVTVPISKHGEYTVELRAKAQKPSNPEAPKCDDAYCSTTVKVENPETPLCCVSPWLFRAFGGWVESQGSNVSGSFTTADGENGPYTFGFNQGLGFGMELERLLAGGEKWDDAKWGWSFGFFRATLDTRWVFDPTGYWLRDDDRVPMLALTTGLNYHWRQPKWDFFAGPVIGFVRFEDGSYADATVKPGTFKASFDDSFAFGARAGFDAFIGKCWGLTGGIEYLKVSTEADFLDVDVDPLILKAGFVYHF